MDEKNVSSHKKSELYNKEKNEKKFFEKKDRKMRKLQKFLQLRSISMSCMIFYENKGFES
ncbi:MAG: hypothetical protein J6W00_01560 [Lentisphaeria bacterium]|nr:hypothetical protein [Lentisphaeria bacterium]